MKKSVVSALTAAVILGAASTPAFAAQNPFSDVNDHHWAYQSVVELAEAGIITGYDNSDIGMNGRFLGGRNITRYEMAQMIAKTLARIEGESSPFAIQLKGHQWTFVDNSGVRRVVDGTVVPFKLSNGATVDMNKLSELEALVYELQDELTTLGVRVDDLKDHSDKVQWHGKIEYTYGHRKDGDDARTISSGGVFRLEPVAYLDDNCWVATGNDLAPSDDGYRHGHWTARARLDSGFDMRDDYTNNTKLKRVWAQGDWNNFQVQLGRFGYCTPEEGIAIDSVMSGGKVTFGSKWKASLAVGRVGNDDEAHYGQYAGLNRSNGFIRDLDTNTPVDVVGVNVQYDDPGDRGLYGGVAYYYGKSDAFKYNPYAAEYDKAANFDDRTDKASIFGANLGYRFSDMLYAKLSYARNGKAEKEKDGWDAIVRYGKYGDNPEKGDWAVWAGYSKFGINVAIASDQSDDIQTGSKGWHIGAAYAPFKNVGVMFRYGHGKYITTGDRMRKIFARAEFFF